MSSVSNSVNEPVERWVKNPFPEGTRQHESWKETGLQAEEELALLHSEMLESMPPEEASEKKFLDHLLNLEKRTFDISALLFWRRLFRDSSMVSDEVARFFVNLLGQLKEATVARASKLHVRYVRFIPQDLLLSEIRTLSSQREKYWTGQILKAVREHKETTAKAAATKREGARSTTGNPILDEIYAGGENLSPAAQEAVALSGLSLDEIRRLGSRKSSAATGQPDHRTMIQNKDPSADGTGPSVQDIKAALDIGDRKKAVTLWIEARKKRNLKATKAALYSEASQDKSEYYRWERGELRAGSQADRDISAVLLKPLSELPTVSPRSPH